LLQRRANDGGVYRRGFAGSQAYDAAYRLFTTLARFDPVYHGHFKCNRNKLTEMAVLSAYARDLFQTPGFGDTIDFVQIKQHYYMVHADINPTGIVPKGPELADWLNAHDREALGGRIFGGTRPGPPLDGERVPASRGRS
jgi:putative glutathione S-transferase